jgi:hypothetical protein
MTELFQFIWPYILDIGAGLLCSVPGLIVNYYLVKKGMIRDNKIYIFVCSPFAMIACRLFFPQIPLWLAMIAIGFSLPSGAFRNDLSRTFSRGRWWWKTDKID